MMFKVSRASQRGIYHGRPCEEAYLRTCDQPSDDSLDWEFDFLDPDEIEDLRKKDPDIADVLMAEPASASGLRDFNYMWAVHIDASDLLEFITKHGKCIVRPGDPPHIVIYDTYVE